MDIRIEGSKIVVADDSATTLQKMKILIEHQGFEFFGASDGEQCLELVEQINPDLIILDLDMPKINGMDVCRTIKNNEKTSLIPVIILTASGSKNDKNLAISAGANDYLDKSFEVMELKLKIVSLLKLKYAIDQLENANNIIKSLVKAVEVKDKYTVGHAERVSEYAVKIGADISLNEDQLKNLAVAGLIHDIGKIGIPDQILNKPGKLTDVEFDIIKQHPVIGEEICAPIKSLDKVRKIIRHHHEKLNGRGYPDGLKESELFIETKIMAVADIYDAVTSDRAYRKGMDNDMAFRILDESVDNGELDPVVVKSLRKIIKECE